MPCLGKLLFWSYSWKSSQSIILEDYVIRYICGWNQLISWILCIWTDYQKRKTSNLIFLTRQLGMPSIPNTPRELRGYLRAVVSPHTFHRATTHSSSQIITANPFFFLSGFSSQILKIHRTAGEGRRPSFIPLYRFQPLTNIETFICNVACEMTITHF